VTVTMASVAVTDTPGGRRAEPIGVTMGVEVFSNAQR
jgi:hypothetical protein